MKGWGAGRGQIFLFLLSFSFPLLPDISEIHFPPFLLTPPATFPGYCPAYHHNVHTLDVHITTMIIFSSNVPHTCDSYICPCHCLIPKNKSNVELTFTNLSLDCSKFFSSLSMICPNCAVLSSAVTASKPTSCKICALNQNDKLLF